MVKDIIYRTESRISAGTDYVVGKLKMNELGLLRRERRERVCVFAVFAVFALSSLFASMQEVVAHNLSNR